MRKVTGPPPVAGGTKTVEEYAEVPLEMVDKVFRLPRIYDPRHPDADQHGRRPAHPREHRVARQQESGAHVEADTAHNVHDW